MPLTMGMLKRPNAGGGVAPTIASVSTYGSSSNGTSHSVPFPSGTASGNLLVCIMGNSAGASMTSTDPGWSGVYTVSGSGGNLNTLRVVYKIATGSEGSTLSMTTSSSTGLVVIMYRVTGNRNGYVAQTDLSTYVQTIGNSSAPDGIANADTAWGTTNNLWINAISMNSTGVTVNSYPANYTLGQTIASTSGTASAFRIAACARQLEAASDNPGAYSLSGSAYILNVKPVIRPPS